MCYTSGRSNPGELTLARVQICQTLIRPREVAVASSKGDGTTYIVIPSTLWSDAVCDCKGFQYRGDCRHIAEVEGEGRCDWHLAVASAPRLATDCPKCGHPVAIIELEPEYD